jgi:hypothetical protein
MWTAVTANGEALLLQLLLAAGARTLALMSTLTTNITAACTALHDIEKLNAAYTRSVLQRLVLYRKACTHCRT